RPLPAEGEVSFEWPVGLLGLSLLPLLVFLYVHLERRRVREGARFGTPALLPNLVDRAPGMRRHLPVALLLVALAALVVGVVPPTSVLMISDGARDGGTVDPRAAARKARALHVPVYTVLVGTPNGTVVHKLTGGYNEIIRVPPSPSTLRQIAHTSGGQFFT